MSNHETVEQLLAELENARQRINHLENQQGPPGFERPYVSLNNAGFGSRTGSTTLTSLPMFAPEQPPFNPGPPSFIFGPPPPPPSTGVPTSQPQQVMFQSAGVMPMSNVNTNTAGPSHTNVSGEQNGFIGQNVGNNVTSSQVQNPFMGQNVGNSVTSSQFQNPFNGQSSHMSTGLHRPPLSQSH